LFAIASTVSQVCGGSHWLFLSSTANKQDCSKAALT
jgi:hypothetical protein